MLLYTLELTRQLSCRATKMGAVEGMMVARTTTLLIEGIEVVVIEHGQSAPPARSPALLRYVRVR